MAAPVSRLGRQIAEVTAALRGIDAQFALIGGLALASHNVVRGTQDVDLLVDVDRADDIHAAMVALGYSCLHRSADAGNYSREDRLSICKPPNRPQIAGQRQGGKNVLWRSAGHQQRGVDWFQTPGLGERRAPHARHGRHPGTIARQSEHCGYGSTVDMKEVREYFQLFDRMELLDELLREID